MSDPQCEQVGESYNALPDFARPPAPEPLLDTVRLAALEDALGPAQVAALLAMLADSTRDALFAADRMIAAGDLAGAAREGHSLKGAALAVGAARLTQAARALEAIASSGDAPAILHRLRDTAGATIDAIEARASHLRGRPSS
ncbi:MAG TPA: Hpt domain-containing protein [Sphingomonas sp.]|nr:Hpt domain-containing protein [Sphingomonas sp.]